MSVVGDLRLINMCMGLFAVFIGKRNKNTRGFITLEIKGLTVPYE